MIRTTLKIEGMMCAHCQAHVQKALAAVPGVTAVQVSLEQKQAVVTATPAVTRDAKEQRIETMLDELSSRLANLKEHLADLRGCL